MLKKALRNKGCPIRTIWRVKNSHTTPHTNPGGGDRLLGFPVYFYSFNCLMGLIGQLILASNYKALLRPMVGTGPIS